MPFTGAIGMSRCCATPESPVKSSWHHGRMFARRVAAASLAVMLASCGASVTRTREASTIAPSAAATAGAAATPISKATPASKPLGPAFVLVVTDQNGLHPAGIPVRMTGPRSADYRTDSSGEVKVDVPGGSYNFQVVPGCGPDLLVEQGGSARVGINPAQPIRGTLKVTWQHRFGPAPPVFTDQSGDWPKGTKVHLTYTVSDRCTDKTAPGKSFPTFSFVPSANLQVAGAPGFRSDPKGRAKVDVTCTKSGTAHLYARDKANPSDNLDLVAQTSGFGGVPRCA
jgi:hypothetical protein